MNVVGLQHAAQIRLVRRAAFEPVDRRLLVAEGFEKRKGEGLSIERLLGQLCDGFFNLDCIHGSSSPSIFMSLSARIGADRAAWSI